MLVVFDGVTDNYSMAETVLSLLVDYLLPALLEEVSLLGGGVTADINQIKRELQFIQNYLKDADAQSERGETSSNVAKTYVKNVREQAYAIEDVIDKYIISVAKRQQSNKIINFLDKVIKFPKKLIRSHDIANEMQEIKTSVEDLHTMSIRHGFSPSVNVIGSTGDGGARVYHRDFSWQDHRASSIFVDEMELVGFDAPRDKLLAWLDEKTQSRSVISIVGMGGIGKSTLAKKVYDRRTSNSTMYFACHAWVIVSKLEGIEELLRSLICQFYESANESTPSAIHSMDLKSLIETTQKYLKEKRYIVLLDDVWATNTRSIIGNILPNNPGCKLIITTQNENVARSGYDARFDHLYILQPLNKTHSWQLFCKKAFESEFGGCCPRNLEEQSRKIVNMCEGLPLAIVIVGSLLSATEMNVSEWKEFHDNLGSGLGSNPGLKTITKIMSLSYNDLPHKYRPCFLYLGLFPEDHSINCKRLVKLWIAEGFLKAEGVKTMEDMGEECLRELIQRNLVHVSAVNTIGKFKRCRVHQLMREIILLKSHELSFCQILAKDDSSMEGATRRLSICYGIDNATANISKSLIRSVFFFKASGLTDNFMPTFCSKFNLLRVFDLQYAPIDGLPKEVGDLLNLRYLSVRGTKIKLLPKSIGKLLNLQTLDLKFTCIQNLPVEIKRLEKLQYLLSIYNNGEANPSFNPATGVEIHNGIGRLVALQKLYCVHANNESIFDELGNLRLLRKLGITKLTETSCKNLCSSIQKLKHLRSLSVHATTENEMINLSSISLPPPYARHVNICGRIAKLPDWISKLKDLLILSLGWSGLTDDPLPLLEPLANLKKLFLRQAYEGKQLHFKNNWFPCLKVLGLTHLPGLEILTIDKLAMPILKELTVGPSPKLKEVPSGIEHLKNLTTLRFFDMSREFVLRILPPRGPDFGIVQHITTVLFNCSEGDHGCRTFTLNNPDELNRSYLGNEMAYGMQVYKKING